MFRGTMDFDVCNIEGHLSRAAIADVLLLFTWLMVAPLSSPWAQLIHHIRPALFSLRAASLIHILSQSNEFMNAPMRVSEACTRNGGGGVHCGSVDCG